MELLKEEICESCGGQIVRSGHDIGREKGMDDFIIIRGCENCGGMAAVEKVESCHVCGGDQPDEAIESRARIEIVTGIYEFLPGIPTHINVCVGCIPELDKKIDALMDEVFEEGGFE